MILISIHSAIASGDIQNAEQNSEIRISIHSAIASGDYVSGLSRYESMYFNPLRHR